ncbi:ATP-binding protein [Parasphingorhabdus sp. NYA22]
MTSEAKNRTLALLLYLAVLLGIQHWCISSGLTPGEKSIWLYGGIASLLFGSRLLNPYFVAPADTAANGFVALLVILPVFPEVKPWTDDAIVVGVITSYAVIVALGSIAVIVVRRAQGTQQTRLVQAIDRAMKGLGRPNVIFGFLILSAVWLFHRDNAVEAITILVALIVITVIRPFEVVLDFFGWVGKLPKPIATENVIGTVAAHQSPGMVLIRQADANPVARGTPMVVSDQHGPPLLAVALNYVGRDEGNLLRAVTGKLPASIAARAQIPASVEAGTAYSVHLEPEEAEQIAAIKRIERLCGIVDSDTSIEYMEFEVVDESGLSEGCLVEARIGDERNVIYQVIDGVTREEVVQQKNKYGYARAKARKIGAWNEGNGKFIPVSWLPKMNAPVFLLEAQDQEFDPSTIGHFPDTPYGVRFDVTSAVTHNTAILGILGVGKSYLAIELVERMISEGVKVLCLDLTNQYQLMLADFLDEPFEEAKRQELMEAGKGGKAHQNRVLGGSKHEFKKAVIKQLRQFMSGDDDHFLRIVNPAQFRVTKQPSFMSKGESELMPLTASEITAVFSDAALFVCQELGMTENARLCLVYEEAHSLVPEWNSVAQEGDRLATSTSARAILQGRKFGLGCLLITQRTANVTKTILNQCNSIFAMRTFDDTGKDFLGNYIGSDYASVLPSLQSRQAVIFGKSSSCENPVLVRLNDAEKFRPAFRADHPPKVPTPYEPEEVIEDGEAAAETAAAADEGIAHSTDGQ